MYIKIFFRLYLKDNKNFHMYKYSFHPAVCTYIYIYIRMCVNIFLDPLFKKEKFLLIWMNKKKNFKNTLK